MTDKIEQQIKKKEQEIEVLKAKLEKEKNKVTTLIIDGVEYETNDHDKGKRLSDIKVPEGWRLWTAEECIKIYNKHRKKLNFDNCWFFIKQPFELNKKNDYVARFDADSDRADLSCDRNPGNSSSGLGVRFARDVKEN